MIKIVILDDNKESIIALQKIIDSYFSDLKIIASFINSEEAFLFFSKNKFDLLFLDIDLGKTINGLEVAELIGNNYDFKIVFFTGNPDKAINAIRLNAFDYLTKPISIKDLRNLINRYQNNINKESLLNKKQQLSTSIKVDDEKSLTINTHQKTMYLKPSEIILIKANGAYSTIECTNGRSIRCAKNLAMLSKYLNEEIFLRISRSIIINKEHIEHLKKGENKKSNLVMKENNIIPLSSNIKQNVFKMIGKKTKL